MSKYRSTGTAYFKLPFPSWQLHSAHDIGGERFAKGQLGYGRSATCFDAAVPPTITD